MKKVSKEQFRPELTDEDRREMAQATPDEVVDIVGRLMEMKKMSLPDTEPTKRKGQKTSDEN